MSAKKVSIGQFLAQCVGSDHNGKVVKIHNHYYNRAGLAKAASCVDDIILRRQLDQETMSAFETTMLDILIDIAGFEDREAFGKALEKANT